MNIVWSEEALDNYFKTVDYLLTEWNTKVALEFDNQLNNLVERIQNFDEICPKSKLLNYHKCKIDAHNSLIYEVINHKIFIVSIIDNRSNHSY